MIVDAAEIAVLCSRESARWRDGLLHDLIERPLAVVREIQAEALEQIGLESRLELLAALGLEVRVS